MIAAEVEKLVAETRHLTAAIPRAHPAPPRKINPIFEPSLRIEQTVRRIRQLTADLLEATNDLRGMVAAMARETLQEKAEPAGLPRGPIQMAEIAGAAIEDSGFTLQDLRAPSRVAMLVHARKLVMQSLRAEGYKVTEIGQFLNRDHGCVSYAINGDRRKRRTAP